MKKRNLGLLMAAMLGAGAVGDTMPRPAMGRYHFKKQPEGLGGNPRAFYGFGNRQHRPHRKTAAQRYHRASGNR